jgi:hypothetical protein
MPHPRGRRRVVRGRVDLRDCADALWLPFLVEGDARELSREAMLDIEVRLPMAHQRQFAPSRMVLVRQLASEAVARGNPPWGS